MNLGEIYNNFETEAPPLLPTSEGLQYVEDLDGTLGLGYPQYVILDGFEFFDLVSALPGFSGSPNCFYTDIDGDGNKDMIIPLGGDFTGDGVTDFAYVVDDNGNGIPDYDPSGVFYLIDSPDYKRITEARSGGGIIIMSPDGTMTVYDPAGTLTRESYNEAYALWLKDNRALEKQFDYYSVSEALLLPVAIAAVVTLLCKIFKRRKL